MNPRRPRALALALGLSLSLPAAGCRPTEPASPETDAGGATADASTDAAAIDAARPDAPSDAGHDTGTRDGSLVEDARVDTRCAPIDCRAHHIVSQTLTPLTTHRWGDCPISAFSLDSDDMSFLFTSGVPHRAHVSLTAASPDRTGPDHDLYVLRTNRCDGRGTCVDHSTTSVVLGYSAAVEFDAEPGETFVIAYADLGHVPGPFTLDVACVTCGDGVIAGTETCDDGNATDGDGCSSDCHVEPTFACEGVPSVCSHACGNGVVDLGETCDDRNAVNGDGCTSCVTDRGWGCHGAPSICTRPACGDGTLEIGETCDDGNTVDGDGCTSDCRVEGALPIDALRGSASFVLDRGTTYPRPAAACGGATTPTPYASIVIENPADTVGVYDMDVGFDAVTDVLVYSPPFVPAAPLPTCALQQTTDDVMHATTFTVTLAPHAQFILVAASPTAHNGVVISSLPHVF